MNVVRKRQVKVNKRQVIINKRQTKQEKSREGKEKARKSQGKSKSQESQNPPVPICLTQKRLPGLPTSERGSRKLLMFKLLTCGQALRVSVYQNFPAFAASSMETAVETVIPTIGLLPAPMRPIISTCAGTEDDPANCASECMRPMVSVIP